MQNDTLQKKPVWFPRQMTQEDRKSDRGLADVERKSLCCHLLCMLQMSVHRGAGGGGQVHKVALSSTCSLEPRLEPEVNKHPSLSHTGGAPRANTRIMGSPAWEAVVSETRAG